VTIGIGFLCEDGIVLSADTQITWPQDHKDYECKLYPHTSAEWSMLNTFAGDPHLAKSFNGKFDEAIIRVAAPYTPEKIRDVIETVLEFLHIAEPTDVSMLCGIACRGDLMRVKTWGKTVSSVTDNYDYVGVGDSSVLRYLGQMITQTDGRPYRVKQAVKLATYLVLKAKTFIDGCGGDTDALILRPDGHLETIGMDPYNIEQWFLRLEKRIKTVIAQFLDSRVSHESFDKTLEALVKELKNEHYV